jgi:signal peptidase I
MTHVAARMVRESPWELPYETRPAVAQVAMRRARRVLGGLLTFTIVLGVAAFAVGGLVFHLGLSPVLSGSMRPAFSPGDAVLTRAVPVSSLRPGQIAVFVPPKENAPYAHRVVTVAGSPAGPVITTKGDANPAADPWHAALTSPTVPVVVLAVPYLGRALVVVHQPWTRAALIALLGLSFTFVGTRALLRPATPSRTVRYG